MKHNYPKTRKARDVSKSKSYKILHDIGEEKLRSIFSLHGRYTSAKILSEMLGYEVSSDVACYCKKRYKL